MLVVLYALFVNDGRLARHQHPGNVPSALQGDTAQRAKLRALVSTPAVIFAYVGSGLQLFMAGALFAWLPSYLNRAYPFPDKAGIAAASFILLMGVGMIVCGVITDRLTRNVAIRKWTTALVFTTISLVALLLAFAQEPGTLQLVLIAVGTFFTAGTTRAAGAMVANLTPASIRATAFGTLTLANNLLGLAAGPLIVGALADKVGLVDAMKVAPWCRSSRSSPSSSGVGPTRAASVASAPGSPRHRRRRRLQLDPHPLKGVPA